MLFKRIYNLSMKKLNKKRAYKIALLKIAKELDDPDYYKYMAYQEPFDNQVNKAFEYGYQMGYRDKSNDKSARF